ncbi:MAG: MarC family protein [Deltaproteobacteria bacterium]|nr:MarC family protein [Deltaproteobacteria bacterium]
MKPFWLSFLPLFVAMDVVGNVPIVISLTSDMSRRQVARVVRMAGVTALVVGLLFMWFGKPLLAVLHVSPADFKIAGGLVLFVIAVSGVMHEESRNSGVLKEHIGAVPIGVPLMVGPATLVTLLLLADLYPMWAVTSGLVVNVAVSLFVFQFSRVLERVLHVNAIRAISKVVHFFLAAIAIMMVRVGIMEVLALMSRH